MKITKYVATIITVALLALILSSDRSVKAETLPNPQSLYNDWLNRFVTSSGASGFLRVRQIENNDSTVSEAQGYGLLLSAYRNDKDTFDKLLAYTEKYLGARGLMHWKIDRFGNVIGENSATDGDEDIAYALLVAYYQWGEPYNKKAHDYITNIFKYEVEPITYVLKPGDVWGGSNITNPSYCAPAYYRAFAIFTSNTDWDKVIDRCYNIIMKARDDSTGLVPDWTTIDGTSATTLNHNLNKDNFSYNAIRVPWRLLMDYKWYNEPRAFIVNNVMAKFFANQDQLRSGYTLRGEPIVSYFDTTFAAGIAAAAAASTENTFATKMQSRLASENSNSYYGATLRVLSFFLLSDNFPALNLPKLPPSDPEPLPSDPEPLPEPQPPSVPQSPLEPQQVSEPPPLNQYIVILEDPDDGQEISGEKKIKAYIDGLNLGMYTMTYSVDGSKEIAMADTSGKFKQAKVQFDSWTWNGRGPYKVTITARDIHGQTIGLKTFILFIKQ